MTEITYDRWANICAQFTRSHRGWLATLGRVVTGVLESAPEAVDAEIRVIVRETPFLGITLEERRGNRVFLISTGEGKEHITHRVDQPRRLILEKTPEGAHTGLRIDANDGQTTLLRFRAAAQPEALDGLAESEH